MKFTQTLKIFLLICAAALFFSSCAKDTNTVSKYSPKQIAGVIIASQDDISVLVPLDTKEDYFEHYFSEIYKLKSENLKDGIIFYADGMIADEIAVFLLDENADIKEAHNALLNYIDRRIAAFTGYSPKQTAILEKGTVIVHGNYIALIICQDPSKAKSRFLACFSDNPPELPPEITDASTTEPLPSEPEETTNEDSSDVSKDPDADDIYDPDTILEAWKSGDSSGLSHKNKSIFDKCESVISEIISDGMSGLEKETAIFEWIIKWADYDMEANNNSPNAKPDPDNDNPYGALMHKKAICMGYSSTFKLFMDMLDIECIIVEGIARHNGGDHAWNMVRLDDKWYCVDVTWNDTIDSETGPDVMIVPVYFNVTSDFMRASGHIWDESNVPEATG